VREFSPNKEYGSGSAGSAASLDRRDEHGVEGLVSERLAHRRLLSGEPSPRQMQEVDNCN
jgi:hypothetical protein